MFRMNPIFKKELKQTARMRKVMVLLLVFNSLLIIFGLFAFYLIFQSNQNTGKPVNYADILRIYTIISAIEFLLVIFLTPGLTAGAISGEREKQTLDILLSTGMSPREIVLGKLFASIHFMLFLIISSLPILGIVFYIGGITFTEILRLMVLLFLTAIYIGSIGIMFSSICKRSTIATVSTYAAALLLTAGLTFLLFGSRFVELVSADAVQPYSIPKPIEANSSFLLLLFNPIFSFASLIHDQIGFGIGRFGEWKASGPVMYYIIKNWYVISLVAQGLLSIIMLYISKKIISPPVAWKHKEHHKH